MGIKVLLSALLFCVAILASVLGFERLGNAVGVAVDGGKRNWWRGAYATGPATGTSDHVTVGGPAGRAFSVKNSYAAGAVEVGADGIGGGMVGYLAQGTIAYSYSIGAVSGGPASILGSFIGHDGGKTVADYWNTDVGDQGCGEGDCEGVTGLSTDVLKAQLPPGFPLRVWGQDADHIEGYPYLLAPLKRFP